MKAVLTLLVVLALSVALHASDLEPLIRQIKQTKKTDGGISADEQEIAAKLQAIGPTAIPDLLHLLNDPNPAVRDLAGYALRDMEGLKEEHLDALIHAFHGDGGWLAPAIARIGTPRAVSFLVTQFLHERQTASLLDGAINMLGEKAVPRLLAVYQPGTHWDTNLESTMYSVFRSLGSRANGAIVPLLAHAQDKHAPRELRVHAIAALGAIGLPAERIVPDLQKLAQSSDPHISAAATTAIQLIGGESAVPIYLAKLEGAKSDRERSFILAGLLGLDTRGRSAGPSVTAYLNSSDWYLRIEAARTLGAIDYTPGTRPLIDLLASTEDWRAVLAATESLGRLGSKEALPALTKTSRDYWYPPVRKAAELAISAIGSGGAPRPISQEGPWAWYAFDYEQIGGTEEQLSYEEEDKVRLSYLPQSTHFPKTIINDEAHHSHAGGLCGIQIEGGYLVGTDRGEWGGEITFHPRRGNPHVILRANTEAIYQTREAIYAVTGLAHLSGNEGLLYKLEPTNDGGWKTTCWLALPGAPRFSRLLKDGNLFVNCHSGMVLISPDGKMRSLSRKDVLEDGALGTSRENKAN